MSMKWAIMVWRKTDNGRNGNMMTSMPSAKQKAKDTRVKAKGKERPDFKDNVTIVVNLDTRQGFACKGSQKGKAKIPDNAMFVGRQAVCHGG